MHKKLISNFVLSLNCRSFSGSGSLSVGGKAAESKEAEEDESDEPPKVEVAPIVEEDSIHSVR